MDAKVILLRAVECDQVGRILEAQQLYQEGIQILRNLVAGEPETVKRNAFNLRIKEYVDRAEEIQRRIAKQTVGGRLLDIVSIEEDATGYSYETLFSKYLDAKVIEVLIEEPYLYENYHFMNLTIFFELLVKRCKALKYVRVVTKPDTKPQNGDNQSKALDILRKDLMACGITLQIRYDATLHDRKIVLVNSYLFKIGRGLHFFKPTPSRFTLGMCDFSFRKCLKTDVDISAIDDTQ